MSQDEPQDPSLDQVVRERQGPTVGRSFAQITKTGNLGFSDAFTKNLVKMSNFDATFAQITKGANHRFSETLTKNLDATFTQITKAGNLGFSDTFTKNLDATFTQITKAGNLGFSDTFTKNLDATFAQITKGVDFGSASFGPAFDQAVRDAKDYLADPAFDPEGEVDDRDGPTWRQLQIAVSVVVALQIASMVFRSRVNEDPWWPAVDDAKEALSYGYFVFVVLISTFKYLQSQHRRPGK